MCNQIENKVCACVLCREKETFTNAKSIANLQYVFDFSKYFSKNFKK